MIMVLKFLNKRLCLITFIYFISAPPTIASTEIVKILKSVSANTLFKTFPNLKKNKFWGSGLWSKGYYVGTAGAVSSEIIVRYIQDQKLK